MTPEHAMSTAIDTHYRLDDNLIAGHGRIFLNGTQALVRLLLAQKQRDQHQGLNTAGFVTGYRGSPLAAVDTTLWKANEALKQHAVTFLPAINEDLAATIVMGTQQAGVRQDRKVDGVFAMWYGKGPGVDRAGDALHHGHAAGASAYGGVLMIVGDDHTASSSSIPHASEHSLKAWSIPVINPASVEEYEWFGLWGWALSRYSGAWVAFKAVTETIESGRSFTVQPVPDFHMPAAAERTDDLHYSAKEFLSPAIEPRIQARLQAVSRFAHRHPLDKLVEAAPGARLGIVSTGKAFLDTREALRQLRANLPHGVQLPEIRHYKVGLSWPLQADGLMSFAQGLDRILVIEEKKAFIETQIKEMLFNSAFRPQVLGKTDEHGAELISSLGQLTPAQISRALRRWLGLPDQANRSGMQARAVQRPANLPVRKPYFCSGCPHNTSTRLPEGSQALAGVGCHYMATWMNRDTSGLTQMGGEGTDWIGLAPFVATGHMFQNMGEGTYFHSGYLAIRQSIAAKANITYKILFNDAVAMTGGQPVDGSISVSQICEQLHGEGVKRIVITTEDPKRYAGVRLPDGITVHHRRELVALQEQLREIPGVTALIHDQVCAAEKRRRSKKKAAQTQAASRRVVINARICEGCGDCSKQSNCLSVVPLETPLGRKRTIDQSSCNTDFSCVEGFCPSFVSVIGGTPRRRAEGSALNAERVQALLAKAPAPALQTEAANILVAGVGGTGVITVGAVVAMAAHLQGLNASVLDMTGLAQKGGAVISHVRISSSTDMQAPVRIDQGQADVALVCDMIAATRPDALATLDPSRSTVIINEHVSPTASFVQDPDAPVDGDQALNLLKSHSADERTCMLDAHALALHHFGDSVFSNMIMLGYAWQSGQIPVTEVALMRALELNGVAVERNQNAFRLGRLAAWQPRSLRTENEKPVTLQAPEPMNKVIEWLYADLETYQNANYAAQFRRTIDAVLQAERRLYPERAPRLARTAAMSLHKLMAIKDEYEVARQLSAAGFHDTLREQFEGDFQLRYHLAPPLLAPRDKHTGLPRKITLGSWIEPVFRALARLKWLRDTPLDVFGYTRERRTERKLAREFDHILRQVAAQLNRENYAQALELAGLPAQLRGFGHVKAAKLLDYTTRMQELSTRFTGHPARKHEAHSRVAH
jgi:indolepyruvate ferredoxin oxidoreductase